jgi:threonine/homoserine/homoserine lactone efflux protein
MSSLALGLGFGLFVGGQPGPVSLLCARSVLRGAFATGVAIGAGAAVIDALYAALGLAGAATAFELEPLRIALGIVGAVVLAAIGTRTLWSAFRVRLGGESDDEVAGPRRAFVTALAATASNPLTIATWAALFTAAGSGTATAAPLPLIAGVALGTLTAFSLLSGLLAVVRTRIGEQLLALIDVVAGAGLLGFAGLLSYRTATHA